MIGMQLSFQGAEALRQAFEQAPDVARAELLATVERLVKHLERAVQDRYRLPGGPNDTGVSANSIRGVAYAVPAGVLGVVASPRAEVTFIELGTRPHWAPIKPLHEWVQRKLRLQGSHAWAVAKVIQKNIAARGTVGRRIFEQVLIDNQATIQRRLDNATARIVAKLQAGPGAPA